MFKSLRRNGDGVPTRDERAANKLGDVFSDERLNVVQLGHLTATTFTPSMANRLLGWLHWHNHIAERVELRDDGGVGYIDGEYLEYIKRQNKRPY
jgi:hypothetical protein